MGVVAMPVAVESSLHHPKINPRFLPFIDRVLIAGIKLGTTGKHQAISKVLQLVPEWRRGDCWQRIRHLRKVAKLENSRLDSSGEALEPKVQRDGRSWHSWTRDDDDKLLNWAGYEPVEKIAQRLSRSARAVRFRLCALGMSAKATDGWSLRALQKLLRVSPARLRQFIGSGMLRVRDPRVTARSLAAFCVRNCNSLGPHAIERINMVTATRKQACTSERVANLLGVDVKQVQGWISTGQLKVRDTFVTDRSFEEFCKKYGSQTNLTLIDPATRKWLVEEYGLAPAEASSQTVSRARKHALVVRTCKCGRSIAGNVYFRHVRACKVAASQLPQTPVHKFSTLDRTLDST